MSTTLRLRTLKATSDKEIQRSCLTAFAKQRDILKGNIVTYLKRQVYNSCLILEKKTWALITQAKNELATIIII